MNNTDNKQIWVKVLEHQSFLTDEQEQKLFEVITTYTPDQVGIPNRKNWDSNIACQWVKSNFGIEYTPRGMLDVFIGLA
jgi:putative transposase